MKRRNIIAGLVLASLVIVGGVITFYPKYKGRENASKAVKVMYTFDDLTNLRENGMPILKHLCTTDVFNQLTVENGDRALSSYIRFKGQPCEVNILNVTDDYVLYELNSKSLEDHNQYLMFYTTDRLGKLNSVRECQLVDFYSPYN